jgi:hypothetical protein
LIASEVCVAVEGSRRQRVGGLKGRKLEWLRVSHLHLGGVTSGVWQILGSSVRGLSEVFIKTTVRRTVGHVLSCTENGM